MDIYGHQVVNNNVPRTYISKHIVTCAHKCYCAVEWIEKIIDLGAGPGACGYHNCVNRPTTCCDDADHKRYVRTEQHPYQYCDGHSCAEVGCPGEFPSGHTHSASCPDDCDADAPIPCTDLHCCGGCLTAICTHEIWRCYLADNDYWGPHAAHCKPHQIGGGQGPGKGIEDEQVNVAVWTMEYTWVEHMVARMPQTARFQQDEIWAGGTVTVNKHNDATIQGHSFGHNLTMGNIERNGQPGRISANKFSYGFTDAGNAYSSSCASCSSTITVSADGLCVTIHIEEGDCTYNYTTTNGYRGHHYYTDWMEQGLTLTMYKGAGVITGKDRWGNDRGLLDPVVKSGPISIVTIPNGGSRHPHNHQQTMTPVGTSWTQQYGGTNGAKLNGGIGAGATGTYKDSTPWRGDIDRTSAPQPFGRRTTINWPGSNPVRVWISASDISFVAAGVVHRPMYGAIFFGDEINDKLLGDQQYGNQINPPFDTRNAAGNKITFADFGHTANDFWQPTDYLTNNYRWCAYSTIAPPTDAGVQNNPGRRRGFMGYNGNFDGQGNRVSDWGVLQNANPSNTQGDIYYRVDYPGENGSHGRFQIAQIGNRCNFGAGHHTSACTLGVAKCTSQQTQWIWYASAAGPLGTRVNSGVTNGRTKWNDAVLASTVPTNREAVLGRVDQVNGMYTFGKNGPSADWRPQNYMQYGPVMGGSGGSNHQWMGSPAGGGTPSGFNIGSQRGGSAGNNANQAALTGSGNFTSGWVHMEYMDHLVRPGTNPRRYGMNWSSTGISITGGYSRFASSPPTYDGINPIVFHNPVAAQEIWSHDIPRSDLQDQRIINAKDQPDPGTTVNYLGDVAVYSTDAAYPIELYEGVYTESYPTRNYINYDFLISWGNSGDFESAPEQTIMTWYGRLSTSPSRANWNGNRGIKNPGSRPSQLTGDDGIRSPGVRGVGYVGNYAGMFRHGSITRHENNQSVQGGMPTSGAGASNNWLNAKYIKFNVAVITLNQFSGYAYNGPDYGTYVPANTWIKLVSHQYNWAWDHQALPTSFKFHIAHDVLDDKEVSYQYFADANNTPAAIRATANGPGGALQGQAETLYGHGQWLVNSLRNHSGDRTLTSGRGSTIAARYSAKNETFQDVIGRIGNWIVDDTDDPRWANTFWKFSLSEWLIPGVMYKPSLMPQIPPATAADRAAWYASLPGRYLSVEHTMYEEPEGSWNAERAFNRWDRMGIFHGAASRHGTLAVMPFHNVNTSLQYQPIKLGYGIQFSLQTIGDHDNQIHIVPDFELWGDFTQPLPDGTLNPAPISGATFNGNANDVGFALYATETGMQTNWRWYWHSNVNPYASVPFEWLLTHTLANIRAKVNPTREEQTPTVAAARAKPLATNIIGQPKLITLTEPVRTWIGNVTSTGRANKSDGSNVVRTALSGPQPDYESWTNAHRWHGRFSLPSTTKVGINDGGTVRLADQTEGQVIALFFSARTFQSNAPWDLSTFSNANTGVGAEDGGTDPTTGPPSRTKGFQPWTLLPPGTKIPAHIPPGWGNPPVVPESPRIHGRPKNRQPRQPIASFDYSNSSETDAAVVGTH